jgi:hypothetical protein
LNDDDDDDVVHEGDSADWCQHSPSRSYAHKNHNKASSKARASAGSNASQRLDRHKKDRDVILAELELNRAQTETRKVELRLAQMDARVGLSRRSRTSSEASSVWSEEQSAVSSSHR